MRDQALQYLTMGLSIIPLRPRPEPDIKEVAKMAAIPWKPFQTERATAEQVQEWFTRWPTAGIAIITGTISGVIGVDLDNQAAIDWAHANLPPTPWVTISGRDEHGEHWYYRHSGHDIKNGVKLKVGDGIKIDIRGDGGYLVAAPSVHPNGSVYTQAGDWSVSVHDLPAFPAAPLGLTAPATAPGSSRYSRETTPEPAIRQAESAKATITETPSVIGRLLKPREGAQRVAAGSRSSNLATARSPDPAPVATTRPVPVERARMWLAAKPADAGVGERNNAFFACAAAVLNDFELTLEEGLPLLLDWNQRLAQPLDIDEATKAARSAMQRARGPKGAKLAAGTRTTATGRTLTAVDGQGEPRDRPTIRVSMAELPRMVDEGAEALMAEPDLYQRGNALVQVRQDGGKKVRHLLRPPAEPAIVGMQIPRLRELLARSADWVKLTKDPDGGFIETPAPVPEIVAQALAARPSWPFRPLEGIVECPTIRLDGSILSDPGYDEATGLLYLADGTEYRIPEAPTLQEAQEALQFVATELFSDFPFPAEYHRSAAMAALLTVVLRPAIAGPVPMFLLSASTPGAGKGLIAHVCATIATGRPSTLVTPCEREDSFKNAITSVALSGSRVILYDEVHTVGGPTLQSALTQWTWSDRGFHTQSIITVPVRWVWFAAGQNVNIGGDMHRRVIQIRLEPQTESPEDRTDFRNPELEQWALAHRSEVVSAVLTAAKAFCLAGRPQAPITPYGSYYAWSSLIRQMLVWAGWPDPNLTRDEVREAAAEARGPIEAMLDGWRTIFGDRAERLADAVAEIRTCRNQVAGHDMWTALLELAGTKGKDDIDTDRLGKLFRRIKSRIYGGFRLLSEPGRAGTVRWRVATTGGDGRDWVGSLQSSESQSSEKKQEQSSYREPHQPDQTPPPVVTSQTPATQAPAATGQWEDWELVEALTRWMQFVGPCSVELLDYLAPSWPDMADWASAPADGLSYHQVARQVAMLKDEKADEIMAQVARQAGAQLFERNIQVAGNWRTWRWWATSEDTLTPWLAWSRQVVTRRHRR